MQVTAAGTRIINLPHVYGPTALRPKALVYLPKLQEA